VTANRLRLDAQARGGHTVLTRIRADGLLRTSRPFRDGAAARIVVAHLGPGMIRGDAFATSGHLDEGANLVVAGQMATRILSGPQPARHDALWEVGAGALLELAPEPVLVGAGTSYVGTTTLRLAAGARAIVVELLARERGAALRTTTRVYRDEHVAFIDALAIDDDDDSAGAFGTLFVIGTPNVAALDACADAVRGVRAGVGILADGSALVRVVGPGVREVDAALASLRRCCLPVF
jgi:urease accessory protein UreH